MTQYKRPVSVLVVVHTPDLQVLLLERASHAGFWQSVTGSQEDDETLITTAQREVAEETGIHASLSDIKNWQIINTFAIFPGWRRRYAPGVVYNTEHVFSLEVPNEQPVHLCAAEHLAYCWQPWEQAAKTCFSWSNRDAILMLAKKTVR